MRKAKPYCGAHPGNCVVNPYIGPQKKRSFTFLEWNDWIKFNNLINDVLDHKRVDAIVYSEPNEELDKGRKFFLRRGMQRRTKWDWEERYTGHWQPRRIWNHGDDSQFVKVVEDDAYGYLG